MKEKYKQILFDCIFLLKITFSIFLTGRLFAMLFPFLTISYSILYEHFTISLMYIGIYLIAIISLILSLFKRFQLFGIIICVISLSVCFCIESHYKAKQYLKCFHCENIVQSDDHETCSTLCTDYYKIKDIINEKK